MPVVFVCSNCGHALEVYVGGTSSGVPTLESILQYYECPYCHSKLIPDIDMVDVTVYVWKPEKIKAIVEGKIGERELKKLQERPKGRKLLKLKPALSKVLDVYARVNKSKSLQDEIRKMKK